MAKLNLNNLQFEDGSTIVPGVPPKPKIADDNLSGIESPAEADTMVEEAAKEADESASA